MSHKDKNVGILMTEPEALAATQELKKYCLEHGIWYTYQEIVEGSLKFLKMDLQIKVKA